MVNRRKWNENGPALDTKDPTLHWRTVAHRSRYKSVGMWEGTYVLQDPDLVPQWQATKWGLSDGEKSPLTVSGISTFFLVIVAAPSLSLIRCERLC